MYPLLPTGQNVIDKMATLSSPLCRLELRDAQRINASLNAIFNHLILSKCILFHLSFTIVFCVPNKHFWVTGLT